MTSPAVELYFGEDGKIRALYGDDLPPILDGLGTFETRRASAVEPAGGGWYADMAPSGSEVVLGPFPLRGQALAEEVRWLRANVLEVP